MREIRLQWLQPDEVVAERERVSIVYLPIGPLEWHGPHLPLGTDPLQAEHTAFELASQMGGVVHPTLYIGTERERSPELLRNIGFNGDEWIVGMDFPANSLRSYYYPEEIFAITVRFTLDQLVAQGYRLIVIVNGHGATNQIDHLQRLAAEFSQKGPSKVLYTFDLDAGSDIDAGHATITETAAMMAIDPERVNIKKLPPMDVQLKNTEYGIVDGKTFEGEPGENHCVRHESDPRLGSIQLGHQHFETTVARLSHLINNLMK